jgi:hypothetical protein
MPSPGHIGRDFLQQGSLPHIPLICVSYFGSTAAQAHIRFIARRLRRKQDKAQIVLCCWDASNCGSKISEIADSASGFSFALTLHDAIVAVLKFAQSGVAVPYYDATAVSEIDPCFLGRSACRAELQEDPKRR